MELYADGTGRIQNSNNIHTVDPLLEVNFGDEYITDLSFDVSGTTLFTIVDEDEPVQVESGPSGSVAWFLLLFIVLIKLATRNLQTK